MGMGKGARNATAPSQVAVQTTKLELELIQTLMIQKQMIENTPMYTLKQSEHTRHASFFAF